MRNFVQPILTSLALCSTLLGSGSSPSVNGQGYQSTTQRHWFHHSARSANKLTYVLYSGGISDAQKREIVDGIRLPDWEGTS